MSDNTLEMCQQHADGLRDSLEELWRAVDNGDLVDENGERVGALVDESEYDGQEPLEYLDAWPLEVVYEYGTPFCVVFGTGGPHVEITQDLRENRARVAVYWAGERAYAYGDAVQRTADYFRELWAEMH